MTTTRRLLKYLAPYRWRIVVTFFCMVMLALLNSFTIGSLQPILGVFFSGSTGGQISLFPQSIEKYIPYIDNLKNYANLHRWRFFIICCSISIGVGFFRMIFSYFQEYLSQYISESVMLDIRKELYAHLHTLSLKYFTTKDTGSQMARITFDVDVIGKSIFSGYGEIAKEPFTMLFLLVWMFCLSWKLTIVSLIFLPLISYPMVRFGQHIRAQSHKLQEDKAKLNKILLETISGIRIVKAFGMEEYEKNKFIRKIKDLFNIAIRIYKISSLSSPLTEFFGVLVVISTLLLAGYFVFHNQLDPGSFGVFIIALISLYQPFKRFSSANNQIQMGLAGAERVFQLMDTQTDVKESAKAVQMVFPQREIEFHDVSFEYENNTPVLQNINLRLPIHRIVAVVGASGAGKTTLLNLLPRFYDPSSGTISIDGVNIRDVTLKSLRDQMGIVTQDTFLFDDTIFNNIAYGHPDFDKEKVYSAARIAHADEFVRNLPQGYETMIGERGVKLSGGQKQRITIARAILKNPSILIFDEATSSLDVESERLVQDALEKLMLNRTTFIIAHRLSTILRADTILVLDHGRLVEQGTHKELLEKQGIYTKLYQTQFGGVD